MMEIKCEQDVLSKLRPPLSLKVMREYFAELSTFEMKTQKDLAAYAIKE